MSNQTKNLEYIETIKFLTKNLADKSEALEKSLGQGVNGLGEIIQANETPHWMLEEVNKAHYALLSIHHRWHGFQVATNVCKEKPE